KSDGTEARRPQGWHEMEGEPRHDGEQCVERGGLAIDMDVERKRVVGFEQRSEPRRHEQPRQPANKRESDALCEEQPNHTASARAACESRGDPIAPLQTARK